MTVYSEELEAISLGSGLYTSEVANRIPDGYAPTIKNFIATGETLESRLGFQRIPGNHLYGTFDVPPVGEKFTLFDSNSPDFPAVMWPYAGNKVRAIRGNSRFSNASTSGDGYAEFSTGLGVSDVIKGIAGYRDRIYVASNAGIHRLGALNWSTDTLTTTLVSATPANLNGILLFKDRLFAWDTANLYYTLPAAYGGYPETWAATTQNILIFGNTGKINIQQIVPFGSKLLIFTDNGAFTLHVEGDPGSWILRNLDQNCACTSETCAFEAAGIVYYVNTRGVWATDGYTVTKLSGTIEDAFYEQGRVLKHRLHFMDEGMVLSIAPYNKSGTSQYVGAGSIFYTKISIIAWTQWESNKTVAVDFGAGPVNYTGYLSEVVSVVPNVYTFLGNDPITFMYISTYTDVGSATQLCAYQICVYDGYYDQLVFANRSPVVSVTTETDITYDFTTRVTDGGNPTKLKSLKGLYVEIGTTQVTEDIQLDLTRYIVQPSVGSGAGTAVSTVSQLLEATYPLDNYGESLLSLRQLSADYKYRSTFFRFLFTTSGTTASEVVVIKIGKIYLVKHTERNEVEALR